MKLHLGCGEIRLDGWTNVDVRPTSATDLVEDIAILPSMHEQSVDEIYACHVLEHFGFVNVRPTAESVLRRWAQLLKPGGRLLISVPDMKQVAQAFLAFDNDTRKQFDFLRATFGGCDYPENRHMVGFTTELLTQLFQKAGLEGVELFESFAVDTSRFVLHGIPLSLNLAARKKQQNLSIVTAYVHTAERGRLHDAQMGFLRGALRFDITPIPRTVTAGTRPKMGELLALAREHAVGGWMMFANSDCELIADPRPFMRDPTVCYGFHRREVPSGKICLGVDMYAIPVRMWDEYLSKDVPDMNVGTTHIDWWLSRACEKIDKYVGITDGILAHPSHERTSASGGCDDPGYQHNIREFEAWADRNGADKSIRSAKVSVTTKVGGGRAAVVAA
jgi:predicted SAM-dependent methyltransferase